MRPPCHHTTRPVLSAVVSALASSVPLASRAADFLPPNDGEWEVSTVFDAGVGGSLQSVLFAPDGSAVQAFTQDGEGHVVTLFPGVANELVTRLHEASVPFAVLKEHSDSVTMLDVMLITFAATLLTAAFSLSVAKASGLLDPMLMVLGLKRFGNDSNLVHGDIDDPDVTFDDVAGCDGAKQELEEIVDFLKEPAKYAKLGAKIPKGAIMEGPPGTGKTLLARAVAGEAGVPFFCVSGSEFVEMYVGVGAARVRELFADARENAPCIVFIDEIDAVGGSRAGRSDGRSGEREQTLNQLLVEMDGFDAKAANEKKQGGDKKDSKGRWMWGKKVEEEEVEEEENDESAAAYGGVIVLAATNRADMLDAALLRPGRFDRRVSVDLPDRIGREQILNVHAKGKPLHADVDLAGIARRTVGFSGASLANLMNEAAIRAARLERDDIRVVDFDAAADRLLLGMPRASRLRLPVVQRLVACHEAGHALLGYLLPEHEPPSRVSISPRGTGAGGVTVFLKTDEMVDSGMYTHRYLLASLCVTLGGHAAEEVLFGAEEVSTAAADDLQRVRSLARRMVAQWGFASDASPLGGIPVAWETPEGNGLLMPQCASEASEAELEREVMRIVDGAYSRARNILSERRELLERVIHALVENENLDAKELAALIEAPIESIDGTTTTQEIVPTLRKGRTLRVSVRGGGKHGGKRRKRVRLHRRGLASTTTSAVRSVEIQEDEAAAAEADTAEDDELFDA